MRSRGGYAGKSERCVLEIGRGTGHESFDLLRIQRAAASFYKYCIVLYQHNCQVSNWDTKNFVMRAVVPVKGKID